MLDEAKALEVYQEQRTLLLNCAQRILGDPMRAEDIVHDAWIAACDRAGRQEVREFGAYLYLTVRNMAIDALRRDARYQAIAGGDYETASGIVADPAPAADARIEGEQELERFKQALAQLPERQRIAVEMHRMGGLKFHDIAARFGISTAYAHQLVSQGLAACVKYVKEGR